jgi:uncharacterized phage-associated protein
MYDTFAIANLILDAARKRGYDISPLKLQKLVYYAHGWWLAMKGQPLIKERIQASQYGPIVRSLYEAFKGYGNSSIRSSLSRTGSTEEDSNKLRAEPERALGSLINQILDIYGGLSVIQLSAMSHSEGSPWAQVYNRSGSTFQDVDIADDIIREYFKELISEARAQKIPGRGTASSPPVIA